MTATLAAIAPPPIVPCLAWNAQHGFLSSRDSAVAGKWSDAPVPYVRHWLELASARKIGRHYMEDRDPFAHLTEQIWIVKGSQVGATRSILLAILGWVCDQAPSPAGYFLPRSGDLKEVVQERLLPFFESSPKLNALLPPPGTTERKQRIMLDRWHMEHGMTMYLLCSSIAADLRSRPLCDEYWDEFDMAPQNVGKRGEGDAIELGLGRQKTFRPRRLTVGVTTPTAATAPGWRRLCSGSHERLLVECHECHRHSELMWDQLRIVRSSGEIQTLAEAVADGADPDALATSERDMAARWACPYCGRLHNTDERDAMVWEAAEADRWVPGIWVLDADHPLGLWTPRATLDDGRLVSKDTCETVIRTGHFSSLYSSFVTLAECAAREMRCIRNGSEEEWIAHRNNWRAEPTLPGHSEIAPDNEKLKTSVITTCARGTAPEEAQKVIITCDQQGTEWDRSSFPFVARAWGAGGESWLLDTGVVYGIAELDNLQCKPWWIGGRRQVADAVSVDAANGHVRVYVQQWAQEDAKVRLLLHGREQLSAPVVQRFARDPRKPSRGKRLLPGIRYWYVMPDPWKSMLADRMRGAPGLPPWHGCAELDDQYIASLTSEHQVSVMRAGRKYVRWVPRDVVLPTGRMVQREDTHWWDCEWHQLAVAHILEVDKLKPKIVPPTLAQPARKGGAPVWMAGYQFTP